jgi:putative transposase
MIMEDIKREQERTKLSTSRLLQFWEIKRSTYYNWTGISIPIQRRSVLRVLPEEEQAVIDYRRHHREVGYRKLTWMMNDEEVAAISESSVYQLLSRHNLLGPWRKESSDAEKEYRHKPTRVHEHWHTDLAYVKVRGVFYFLIMLLDGYSRYVLDWELMPDMLGSSVENFIQRCREKFPQGAPKLIHDNGSQFISRDFKLLLSRLDIQQVRTRRNHPETNGKMERLNGTLRQEALRIETPGSYTQAEQVIGDFVRLYNHHRLHAGIKFLRPVDLFEGRGNEVLRKRRERLEASRAARIFANKLKQTEVSQTFLH